MWYPAWSTSIIRKLFTVMLSPVICSELPMAWSKLQIWELAMNSMDKMMRSWQILPALRLLRLRKAYPTNLGMILIQEEWEKMNPSWKQIGPLRRWLLVFQRADIWSLGVTLYCLVVGKVPFHDNNILGIHHKIKTQPLSFPEKCDISPELKDLIGRMLKKDPNERASLQEIKVYGRF